MMGDGLYGFLGLPPPRLPTTPLVACPLLRGGADLNRISAPACGIRGWVRPQRHRYRREVVLPLGDGRSARAELYGGLVVVLDLHLDRSEGCEAEDEVRGA